MEMECSALAAVAFTWCCLEIALYRRFLSGSGQLLDSRDWGSKLLIEPRTLSCHCAPYVSVLAVLWWECSYVIQIF